MFQYIIDRVLLNTSMTCYINFGVVWPPTHARVHAGIQKTPDVT